MLRSVHFWASETTKKAVIYGSGVGSTEKNQKAWQKHEF